MYELWTPAEKKILIAIPSLDYVNYQFVECLTALQKHALQTGLDVTVKMDGGTLVHIARDHLAKHAIDCKYTHVLWLDADMIFPPYALNMLLAEGKDFITGIYRKRRAPFDYTIFQKDPFEPFVDIPFGIFEIGSCGFGCVLTATRLLEESYDLFLTCFKPNEGVGEDICFCKRMQSMHEPLYAHSQLRCGYIAQQIILA